jgi:hypothetical protein
MRSYTVKGQSRGDGSVEPSSGLDASAGEIHVTAIGDYRGDCHVRWPGRERLREFCDEQLQPFWRAGRTRGCAREVAASSPRSTNVSRQQR